MSEHQSTPARGDTSAGSSVAELDDQTDRLVLTLLLRSEFPGLWSVDELAREIGKPIDVADSIHRLHSQGLIHRLEDFVFITHAVACYEQLQL